MMERQERDFERQRERDRERGRDRGKGFMERDRERHTDSQDRDSRFFQDRPRDRSPVSRRSHSPGLQKSGRSPRSYSWDRAHSKQSESPTPEKAYQIGIHTNSDDPKLVKARLYVGNLDPELFSRDEVIDIFRPYGKIIGASTVSTFAFIQYREEDDAKKAIEMEDQNMYKRTKIHVRLACEKSRPGDGGRRGSDYKQVDQMALRRDRLDRIHDPFRDDSYERMLPSLRDNPYRRLPPARDPFFDSLDPFLDLPPPPSIPDRPPFECQLLLLMPELQDYAEMIELKLRSNGLICDVALVNSEEQVTKAVEDTIKRAIPYAIVLRPQNEAMRSVTLRILHGTPQEHRNMPVEDAMGLIFRDFDTYVEGLQKKLREPPPAARPDSSAEFVRPDKQTQYLLNLLADNRVLTVEELDTIMTYLEERRQKIAGPREPPAPSPTPQARPMHQASHAGGELDRSGSGISPKQQNIQKKIMNMLNGGYGGSQTSSSSSSSSGQQNPGLVSYPIPHKYSTPQPVPAPRPTVGSGVSGINFDNPTVQNALDSLFQNTSSLLHNINAISAPKETNNAPSSVARQPLFPSGVPQAQQMMGRMGGQGSQQFGSTEERVPWAE